MSNEDKKFFCALAKTLFIALVNVVEAGSKDGSTIGRWTISGYTQIQDFEDKWCKELEPMNNIGKDIYGK